MPLSSVLGAQSITKPGVCTSTTRPASPFDGQIIYETDTDTVAAYNGTTWIPQVSIPTSFTPTWTTGYNRGNGTTNSRYIRIGNLIVFWVTETLGSTSSVTGTPNMNLPIVAASPERVWAHVNFRDSGFSYHPGFILPFSSSGATTLDIYLSLANGTYVSAAGTSSTVPFTWGTGDQIYVAGFYEV